MINNVDLTKVAVGVFANMGGQPVDYAVEQVLNRAGLHHTVLEGEDWQPHPLRVPLVYTHGGDTNPAIPRLPATFPPADYAGPLLSAQDYLDAIESVRAEAGDEATARVNALAAERAEQEAREKQAAIDATAPPLAQALQGVPRGEVLADSLASVGLDTVGKVQAATPEELQAAEGVGPKTAEVIQSVVSEIAESLPASNPPVSDAPMFTTEGGGTVTPAETVLP